MENRQNRSKKIRKGDRVVAIAGNNKGLMGIVQSCKEDKVIVQGLNMRKKHIKKSEQAPKGKIIDIEKPIHISNLKICVEEDSGVKLKIRADEEGNRQFIYTKDDQEIIYRSVKKPK